MKKLMAIVFIFALIIVGCSSPIEDTDAQETYEQSSISTMTEAPMTEASMTEATMTEAPMTEASVMETTQTMAPASETTTVATTQAPVTTQVETTKDEMPQMNAEGLLEMTIEQLLMYNGENGMPAYVAVENVVYDVSDHGVWTTGSHGGNLAGTDITEMLKYNAPHGDSKLSEIVKVGIIIE